MFDFLGTIFSKITSAIASVIITIGLISIPAHPASVMESVPEVPTPSQAPSRSTTAKKPSAVLPISQTQSENTTTIPLPLPSPTPSPTPPPPQTIIVQIPIPTLVLVPTPVPTPVPVPIPVQVPTPPPEPPPPTPSTPIPTPTPVPTPVSTPPPAPPPFVHVDPVITKTYTIGGISDTTRFWQIILSPVPLAEFDLGFSGGPIYVRSEDQEAREYPYFLFESDIPYLFDRNFANGKFGSGKERMEIIIEIPSKTNGWDPPETLPPGEHYLTLTKIVIPSKVIPSQPYHVLGVPITFKFEFR